VDECATSPCHHGKCWQNSDEDTLLKRLQATKSTTSSAQLPLVFIGFNTTTATTTNSLDLVINYKFDYTRAAGYWCECEPGYSGSQCEIKIDECEREPCGPHGQCVDMVNGFKCVCLPGFTGPTCAENVNECEVYAPCAEFSECHDIVPDYAPLLAGQNVTKSELYLDGYYCDCAELNERLYK
jgi:hypothetical protein